MPERTIRVGGTRRGSGSAPAPGARSAILEEVERAGHWSWLDRPELVDRCVNFLSAG